MPAAGPTSPAARCGAVPADPHGHVALVRRRTRPIRTGHVALMLSESLLHVLDAVGSAPDRAAMAAGLAEALVLSVAAKSPHQSARPSSLAERR